MGTPTGGAIQDIWTWERRNLVMIDNEWTVVLADARFMGDEQITDSEAAIDTLHDEGNPEEEDGAFIQTDTRAAKVTSVDVDMRFMCPTHRMAHVWSTSEENGDVDEEFNSAHPTDIGAEDFSLGGYLDLFHAFDSALPDQDIVESFGDLDAWAPHWTQLRWSIHWALMVVECVDHFDEGVADWVEENNPETGAFGFPTNPAPVGGPVGFGLKYGGRLTGSRLWMPDDGEGAVRYVARGAAVYPYALEDLGQKASASMPVDIDLIDDLDPSDADSQGYELNTSANLRGREIRVRFRSKRNITLEPGQMLIFTVQSGRARLVRELVELEGSPASTHRNLLIAGPTFLNGRGGPVIPLIHYAARVAGTVR